MREETGKEKPNYSVNIFHIPNDIAEIFRKYNKREWEIFMCERTMRFFTITAWNDMVKNAVINDSDHPAKGMFGMGGKKK